MNLLKDRTEFFPKDKTALWFPFEVSHANLDTDRSKLIKNAYRGVGDNLVALANE